MLITLKSHFPFLYSLHSTHNHRRVVLALKYMSNLTSHHFYHYFLDSSYYHFLLWQLGSLQLSTLHSILSFFSIFFTCEHFLKVYHGFPCLKTFNVFLLRRDQLQTLSQGFVWFDPVCLFKIMSFHLSHYFSALMGLLDDPQMFFCPKTLYLLNFLWPHFPRSCNVNLFSSLYLVIWPNF